MATDTPRDERFETPRNSARHGGNSSEDYETPRSARYGYDFETPRSARDFATPRDHYSESKGGPQWCTQDDKGNRRFFNGSDESSPRYDGRGEYHPAAYEADTKYGAGGGYDAKYGAGGGGYGAEPQAKDATDLGYGNVDEKDVEDIFSYARHNRVEDMEAVLDRGVPVNVRDQYGNTLLIVSCQNGHKRAAKMALRKGADINARNYKGNSALHFCHTYGYGDTLGQYLISKGADVSLPNNAGLTPFEGIAR